MEARPEAAPTPMTDPKLARHVGLAALVLYGVGDMIGAGVYATIGDAAKQLGNAVWLAFLGSMIAAMLTGLSYACIASRYPRAAGAAYVSQRAFRFTPLAYAVGLAVLASGLTSMATSSRAFASTLMGWIGLMEPGTPPPLAPLLGIVFLFFAVLTFINFWGIRESMWANAACTLVEVGGLLFVVAVGMSYWGSVDYLELPPAAGPGGEVIEQALLGAILGGAVLTFFSFVGFEDMLNVAEEVKRPEVTMPWGMVLAIVIATLLYIGVSVTVVSVVPYAQLGDRSLGAPLEQVARAAAPWLPLGVFTLITLFAVANTSLLNFVMGSRLAYGMARQGLLPRPLGKVHAGRRTPYVAILTIVLIPLLLATYNDVSTLAKATSVLLLSVFTLINAALIVLKLRAGEPRGRFEVPVIIPALGAVCCCVLLAQSKWAEVSIALVMLAGIAVLYFVMRPKALPDEEHYLDGDVR